MTVSKAYGLLEAEGIVEHRPGLPLAVRAQPPDVLAGAREAALRAQLEPAARAARQLGYAAEDAARLLRDLLTDFRSSEADA
jgi:GntR family transcriptional regulator